MRFEIENEKEVQMALRRADRAVIEAAKGVEAKYAKKTFEKITTTAPVRTGKYKNSWEVEKETDQHIVKTDDPKARYLILPNQKMVGVTSADRPSEGILHNVRGIVHSMQQDYNASMIREIQEAVQRQRDVG